MVFTRMLIKSDFLSSQVQLFSKNETRHKNIFSGILSILITLFSVFAGMYFSVDFFARRNPKSFQFEKFQGSIDRFNISKKQSGIFLFARAYNPITFLQYNSSMINLTVELLETGTITPLATYQLGKCDYKTDFQEVDSELFNDKRFVDTTSFYFCFKEEIKSDGRRIGVDEENYTTPYLQYGLASLNNPNIGIKFSLRRCQNSTGNNYSCLPDSVLNNIMYPVFFEIYGTDHYVDIRNYSNPVETYINNMMSMYVVNGNKMMSLVKMQQFQIVNHFGWLLDSVEFKFGYKFSSLHFTPNVVPEYSNLISETNMLFINTEQIIDRSYPTLQVVSAEIGGIFKFLTMIGLIINYFVETIFIKEQLIQNMFEQLIDFSDFFKTNLTSQNDNAVNNCQMINISSMPIYTNVIKRKDTKYFNDSKTLKSWRYKNKNPGLFHALSRLYYKFLDERNLVQLNFELIRLKKMMLGTYDISLISMIPVGFKDLEERSGSAAVKELERFKNSLNNVRIEDLAIENFSKQIEKFRK